MPATKAGPEMLIIDRMYDLVLWASQHVARLPRSHRFTLGDRLELRLHGILETLVRSRYTSDRLTLLRSANLELELLRFQFRMAKDLKCLSVDSYGHASRATNEVGTLSCSLTIHRFSTRLARPAVISFDPCA